MYSLEDYLTMIADDRRTAAYLAAMREVIRPGDVVLELGTGFGYFAVQAARLGAAQVFAIERNDAVALGPELAAANGVADRITFLRGDAAMVDLPRRADVLLEDLRGTSPLHRQRLPTLLAVRERSLVPGARVVPLRDALQLAPATAPAPREGSGRTLGAEWHGVRLDPIRARVAEAWRRVKVAEVGTLAAAATWATLDYAAFTALHAAGEARFVVERAGRFDGFLSTFEAELTPSVRYSTAAAGPRMIYDAGWFPGGEPLALVPGDEVTVGMRATFDGANYVWAWKTGVRAHDGRFAEVAREHSTLRDVLGDGARLPRR